MTTSTSPLQQQKRSTQSSESVAAHGSCRSEWIRTTVGKTTDLLTGFPFASAGYSDSGVLLVRGSNVKRGVLDWNPEITQYWPRISSDLCRYALRSGDVVVAMDGALVGRSFAQVGEHDTPSLLLQRVARLRGREIDQQLLLHWISSDSFARHVDSVKTHTAIPHISPHDIRSMPLDLPLDKDEQVAIAAALSDVDGLIASLDRLIAKKRAIKQAAMQQLLTGKTRLPGFKGRWDAKPLRSLAEITMGQSPSSSFYNLRGDGLPLIQGNADIEDRRSIARVWTTQASKRCIAGDILLTVRAPVGAVGVASESACLGRGVCGLRPLADSSFLLQALVFAEPRWKILEQGSTFTSANRAQVGQFELRVPLDPSEQHAIAVVLDDMDADLRSLEVRAAKAKAIKQGMMQALLTGRVRLPVTAAAGGQA